MSIDVALVDVFWQCRFCKFSIQGNFRSVDVKNFSIVILFEARHAKCFSLRKVRRVMNDCVVATRLYELLMCKLAYIQNIKIFLATEKIIV
jgi:hypothetical protein